MNDRFKFRVWNKEQNRFHLDISCDISAHGTLILSQGIKGKEYIIDDDNYVIQQCTGLKDKNGKLIYEGDIVEVINCRGANAVVEYNIDLAMFKLKGEKFAPSALQHIRKDYFEVIGNIYENEDLIKCENQ